MLEEWRQISGWPYEVSSLGRVRRSAPGVCTFVGRIRKPALVKGYLQVKLVDGPRRYREYIHLLVLNAFCGQKPAPEYEGAHNDGNPINNIHTNLRWSTRPDNARDRVLHGTFHLKTYSGENNQNARLTDDDVDAIRKAKENGVTFRAIAIDYCVSVSQIKRIVYRKSRVQEAA